MNPSELLLQYAIESGELQVDPIVDVDPYAEVNYSFESRIGEIDRAFALCDSLESLATRYELAEISKLSIENYQFDIQMVLNAAGVSIPSTVVAASFEAAEKDKTTIREKAKAAINAILKWVSEMWKKLLAVFKTRSTNLDSKAKQNTAKAEKVLALADRSIKAGEINVGDGRRKDDQKTADVVDIKSKSEKPKVGQSRFQPNTKQYLKWLCGNGKLDGDGAVSKFLSHVKGEAITRPFTISEATTFVNRNGDPKAYFRKQYDKEVETMDYAKKVAADDVTIPWHQLQKLIGEFTKASEELHKVTAAYSKAIDGGLDEKSLTEFIDWDTELTAEDRKKVQWTAVYFSARLDYALMYWGVLEQVRAQLNVMAGNVGEQKKAA